MKKERSYINSKGFLLIEVILASAIFGLFVTAFIGTYLYGEESTTLAGNRTQAVFLAQEGLEAVRNIRDNNFENLVDGTYGLSMNPAWHFSGSNDTTNIFTREITISSIDGNHKKIISTVTWQQNAQRNGVSSLTTELTNWKAVIVPPPPIPEQ